MTGAATAAWIRTGGWGLYCACSWTWCIGMFLPVIMLDRYGWPGFLVFAIPNVLGCAAFGYVIASPNASRRFVARHRAMLRWFSWVTIAYHCFFAALIAYVLWPATAGNAAGPIGAAAALILGSILLSRVTMAAWPLLAVVVYLVSLGVWGGIGAGGLDAWGWTGERPPLELLWLAPVVAFGFILCPYFDLTFHQALQASGSRHTFAVFGVAFAAMIVFTAAYADRFPGGVTGLLLAHLTAQSVFTVAAHWRALHPDWSLLESLNRPGPILALIAAGAIVYVAGVADEPYQAGVEWYLRFLVFYGLVFPALALWFMRRKGDDAPLTTTRSVDVRIIALLIGIAMPFYELGFIAHHTWLPLIGLAPIVVGGVVRWKNRRAISSPA